LGLPGDIDGDGNPSVGDAIAILRIVVGLAPDNAVADCNRNGSVDIGDAIAVLRCVVGLDVWPIGWGAGNQPGDEKLGPDGQTLVWVPAGSFMMGSDDEADERPIHEVTLDGFWIGKCEVTNDQYATFLNQAQPEYPRLWIETANAGCRISDSGGYASEPGWGTHPVVEVTWAGAVAYCAHYGYVLPSEAQWEYAARGPEASVYPWGDIWDATKCCNIDNLGPDGSTFPVGSFPAGASWCGALDMAGNVWEWCADWWNGTYYATSPGLNPTGPATGEYRAVRSGSWDFHVYLCRSSCRSNGAPTGTRYDRGFRVAVDAP
jgi:formylglycine-generating enzyme required for sulfatase activity